MRAIFLSGILFGEPGPREMLPELKALARVLQSNMGRLRYPYKLAMALTYRCNLRCKICSIWKKTEPPELTLAEIRNLFLASNKFSWVALTGGEAFLRDDMAQRFRGRDFDAERHALASLPVTPGACQRRDLAAAPVSAAVTNKWPPGPGMSRGDIMPIINALD